MIVTTKWAVEEENIPKNTKVKLESRPKNLPENLPEKLESRPEKL
jgi:hypothetical protein